MAVSMRSRPTKHRLYKYSHGNLENGKRSDTDSVYLFSNNSDDEEDIELLPVNLPQKEAETFLEKEVEDGDSLQSLSLLYNCPVSELKRVNNIMRDNEIAARRIIRIPVKEHSLLTEIQPAVHSKVQVRTVSIGNAYNEERSTRDAQRFLQHMDQDLQEILRKTNTYKNSMESVASSLTCKRFYPLERRNDIGADGGLVWWKLLLATFVVVLVLIYFLYVESTHVKHDTDLMDTNHTTTTATPS